MTDKDKQAQRLRALFHQMGQAVAGVVHDLDDEIDRVYLGSTNDADLLRDLSDRYEKYQMETGDNGRDCLDIPSDDVA